MSAAVAEAAPARRASRGLLRRACRSRRIQIGATLTIAVVLSAILGPLLAPHAPSDFVGSPFEPPSSSAPFGTDYLGQDVLSRVLWGGRSVLWMAVVATTLGVSIGLVIGMIAAYSRSAVDGFLMRPTDLVLAFPQIVLVLLFTSFLGPKLWLIVLLVALAWVPQVARVVRGATLEIVGREYVEWNEAIGVPRRHILVREILPNIAAPVLVEYGLRLTWSIGLIAAVSFLGRGIQPPNADWGLMINENRIGLSLQPWAVLVPVLAIALFTVGTNLMADGLTRVVGGIDRAKGDA